MLEYLPDEQRQKLIEFITHPSTILWLLGSLIVVIVIGYFNGLIWGIFSLGCWCMVNAVIYGLATSDDDDDNSRTRTGAY